ncbi:MAG: AhpC/TSA family protein [Chitinophagaceae bacterium]|nr:AhpC/TSA family protein [Chitinophagaceae bacterium]
MQNSFSIQKWFSTICIICLCFACNIIGLKKDEYKAEVILQEKITTKAYLDFSNDSLPRMDFDIVDGKLNFKEKIELAQLVFLYIIHPKTEVRNEYAFFIEPKSSISLNIDSLSTKNYTVTGSKINQEFFAFKRKHIDPIEEQEKIVFQSIQSDQINDQETMEHLLKQSEEFQQQKKQAILDYLKLAPQSIAVTAYALWKYKLSNDFQFLEKVYAIINKNLQQSFYGKSIENIIHENGDIELGGIIKNFTAIDINGANIEFAERYKKSKLMLLEFWSSRCVPCRKENPNLVSLYKQYHSKGFDIISISVDDNEDNWKKAIEQDKLTWTQICDFNAWNGFLPKRYQITETPSNFLVDATGKIIAKNIKGDELANHLKSTFNLN